MEITPAEKTAIDKLRSSLSDVIQPDHNDHYLLQWLRAKNMDVTKAGKMFRESMAWRKKMNVDNLIDSWTPPAVFEKYVNMAFLPGHAKDGTPVLVGLLGRTDIKGLIKSSSDDDKMRYFCLILEKARREMANQTAKLGKMINQVIIIEDCGGLTFQQIMYKQATDTAIKFVKTLEANYPEILKAVYIINAPPVFKTAYKLIKPFLHENTKSKISIYGSDAAKWTPVLLNAISAEDLPKCWGGQMTDPNGDPMCPSVVTCNSKVPKTLYLHAQRDKLKGSKDLTKTTVKNGDKLRLDFTISEPGSILSWEFLTKEHSIGFGIQHIDGSTIEDLVPIEILESQEGVEDGDITCEKAGQYAVTFDNTHSVKHTTKLSYNIVISPPAPAAPEN